MSRKQPVSLPSQMRREVRKAEAAAREITNGDPGTGFTILRLARNQPPLRTLIESRKIGSDELHAADEILQVATAIASRGILHAAMLQRVDFGRQSERDWSPRIALAVRTYQEWQNYWSDEWKRTRNPMLHVVWAAVIDETPIAAIAEDIGYGHRRTTRAVICGIRHYAAWANLVTGTQRQAWMYAAQHVFDRTAPDTIC